MYLENTIKQLDKTIKELKGLEDDTLGQSGEEETEEEKGIKKALEYIQEQGTLMRFGSLEGFFIEDDYLNIDKWKYTFRGWGVLEDIKNINN